jgi:hypothetical protein
METMLSFSPADPSKNRNRDTTMASKLHALARVKALSRCRFVLRMLRATEATPGALAGQSPALVEDVPVLSADGQLDAYGIRRLPP